MLAKYKTNLVNSWFRTRQTKLIVSNKERQSSPKDYTALDSWLNLEFKLSLKVSQLYSLHSDFETNREMENRHICTNYLHLSIQLSLRKGVKGNLLFKYFSSKSWDWDVTWICDCNVFYFNITWS